MTGITVPLDNDIVLVLSFAKIHDLWKALLTGTSVSEPRWEWDALGVAVEVDWGRNLKVVRPCKGDAASYLRAHVHMYAWCECVYVCIYLHNTYALK